MNVVSFLCQRVLIDGACRIALQVKNVHSDAALDALAASCMPWFVLSLLHIYVLAAA